MKEKSSKIIEVKLRDIVRKKFMKKEAYIWMVYVAYNAIIDMGFDKRRIRIRQHNKKELAHYADDAWDIEVKTDRYGWFELCGVHDRTDYDLKKHSEFSKIKMEVNNQVPSILEIAFGLERTTYALLESAFGKEKERDLLIFKPGMAPIDVGIFPLLKRDGLDRSAKEIFNELEKEFVCIYDESGSIGRRYRRMDEVGTSFCITIDHDSLKDKGVTIREVSSMKQVRVNINDLKNYLRGLLYGDVKFGGKDGT